MLNPNRSLDCYSMTRNRKYNSLSSFILLLASCFSCVLAVARYAFAQTNTQSAQQSNEIDSESDDRLRLNSE